MALKRITAVWLSVLVVGAFSHAAHGAIQPAAAKFDQDRIVVMISLDGLAAFYFDDPKAEMPTIHALAEAGTRAESMKASTPTVTWPNHTTLVTGDTPAHHGVVGNNYFDRAANKRVTLISDPVYDKDQIVKVPTIYDLAKAAGMKTAAIRWPASRNAKALDWTFPDVAEDALLDKYTTPSLLAECKEAGIWSHGQAINGPQSDIRIVSDDMCTKVFNMVLHRHRPNLALLHLVDVDHVQHLSGPRSPEAYAAIKGNDGYVREVWDELKRDFPGKATLIIVSDHGFAPTPNLIPANTILRGADWGDAETKTGKGKGNPVRIVVQGGSAMVYILDQANRSSIVDHVTHLFTGIDGISKIVPPEGLKAYGVAEPEDDPHAPDMILFAKEGYAFGDTAAGGPLFNRLPHKGGHGHDADLPDLHATFVAWGVGIKPGARLGEIRNTDVAPTIAALLGLSMSAADGEPLAGALATRGATP